jgi:hypothetical protein
VTVWSTELPASSVTRIFKLTNPAVVGACSRNVALPSSSAFVRPASDQVAPSSLLTQARAENRPVPVYPGWYAALTFARYVVPASTELVRSSPGAGPVELGPGLVEFGLTAYQQPFDGGVRRRGDELRWAGGGAVHQAAGL